jgi:hypothetical protein
MTLTVAVQIWLRVLAQVRYKQYSTLIKLLNIFLTFCWVTIALSSLIVPFVVSAVHSAPALYSVLAAGSLFCTFYFTLVGILLQRNMYLVYDVLKRAR